MIKQRFILLMVIVILVAGCQNVLQGPPIAGGDVDQTKFVEECPGGSSATLLPPVTPVPEDGLPPSMKGYTLQSYCREGEWYFMLTPGLNSAAPCEPLGPGASQTVPSYIVKGIEALKSVFDQMQSGEYVTWCSAGRPDAGIVDDVLAHSEQTGIQMSLMTEPEAGPMIMVTTPAMPVPTASD